MTPFLPTSFDLNSPEQARLIASEILPSAGLALASETNASPRSYVDRISLKKRPIEEFYRVIELCPAIKKLIERAAVEQPGHDAGNAILWLALSYEGGRNWFRKSVVGWDKSVSDQCQIDHAESRSYVPLSCQSMQMKRYCGYTDPQACVTSRIVDGRTISPSPTRLGRMSFNPGEKARLLVREIKGNPK